MSVHSLKWSIGNDPLSGGETPALVFDEIGDAIFIDFIYRKYNQKHLLRQYI